MGVNNWPKLAIIILIILCATAMLALGKLDATQWFAVIGPFGGYLIGNGVAAKQGDPSSPALGPKDGR
jgi:hypothetical protein